MIGVGNRSGVIVKRHVVAPNHTSAAVWGADRSSARASVYRSWGRTPWKPPANIGKPFANDCSLLAGQLRGVVLPFRSWIIDG